MKFTVTTIDELKVAAAQILRRSQYKIFTLKGNLGAGKTTLVKAFAEILKSTDEATSPTFSIVNEYVFPEGKIYHFDLYRLNDRNELLQLGFDEYIDSGNYCFIEWAEISEAELPEHHKISLSLENQTRYLTFD
ncbi:MAG: tRNA (adenosine(37)-N6)-threonylcarbamoyltransferase complex ATPase subunit type 1 TsaE [Flavobacteriaceae bacterium]|jgi:tRNA threonylcarbamoyladenosine biosynthesis protein TsaE|nr:tRNA (adenosine(37)-N6)-threonylcarbamoyltransferase complex ATPase subunit type 1 TsaE [Flavobacteriaceae bacterium]